MKKLIIATGAVCLSAFLLSAQAYTGQELAKDAKITLKEAREIALKAYPGKITDEELEKEKGGSGLRYSFDIKCGKATKTQEVGVDAVTGKILENVQRHGAFAEIATGENGIGAIFSIKFQSLSPG